MRLFVELARIVRLVASRILGARHDLVHDCVQDSLRILIRHIGRLDPLRNVESYASTIARHAALGIQRRERLSLRRGDGLDEELADETDPPSPDPTPLEAAVRAEKIQIVRDKVKQLPPKYRDVVALRLRGASIEEMSDALGIESQGTVRCWLSRAFSILRGDRQLAAAAA